MNGRIYSLASIIMMETLLTACAVSEDNLFGDMRREDGQLAINFLTTSPTIAGTFVDAATGDIIQNVVVTGSVLSDDLDNPEGESFVTDGGMVSFDLGERLPTSEEPVVLTVTASADGFISTSIPVTLSDGADADFTLLMVNIVQPPDGVTVAVDTQAVTDDSGALVEDVVIAVENGGEDDRAPMAEVTLPAGAIFTDEAGEPLTGEITTTVAVFGAENDEALASFPGGFTLTQEIAGPSIDDEEDTADADAVDDDGNIDMDTDDDSFDTRKKFRHKNGRRRGGTFRTAGFVTMSVANGRGQQAANTSRPINVAMAVSPTIDNPATGQKVKAGDEIPLWSLNPQTGAWSYAGNVVLKSGDRWDLVYNYDFNAPSFYNIDWFMSNNCMSGPIKIDGNTGNAQLQIKIYTESVDGGKGSWIKSLSYSGNMKPLQFNYAPRQVPVILDVAFHDRILASITIDDLCTMNETVKVTMPETIELPVIALARCGNTPVEYTLPMRYRLLPNGGWHTGWLKNVMTKLPGIVPASSYEVAINAFNKWFTTTMNSGNGDDLKFDFPLDELTCELFERVKSNAQRN